MAAEAQPGLAAMALSLARLMDDPNARCQQAAAAKALASLLDKLRLASPQGRGRLAVVRTLTEKGVIAAADAADERPPSRGLR